MQQAHGPLFAAVSLLTFHPSTRKSEKIHWKLLQSGLGNSYLTCGLIADQIHSEKRKKDRSAASAHKFLRSTRAWAECINAVPTVTAKKEKVRENRAKKEKRKKNEVTACVTLLRDA